jgi:hypothetical protein
VIEVIVLNTAGNTEIALALYRLDTQDMSPALQCQGPPVDTAMGRQVKNATDGLPGQERYRTETVEPPAAQIPRDRVHGILFAVSE